MIVFTALSLFVIGGAVVLWVLSRISAMVGSFRRSGRHRRGAGKGPDAALVTDVRRLVNAKARLTEGLASLEAQRQGAERRVADAERAALDADRRAVLAEKREEETEWRVQDKERAILRKLEELSEAEKDLAAAKREATEGIAVWTQTQQLKLETRLNEQYRAEVVRLKNEMAQKIHDEIDKIQLYFTEFAASKKTFASNDIAAFLNDRLSRLKVNL